MSVSLQKKSTLKSRPKGARARTKRLMLETAVELMQHGRTPSVTDAAEAAGVSRATAYRYFPSQTALVEAVVDEGLGPILDWESNAEDAEERVEDLLRSSSSRILEFEATFKAAVRLALEQWARDQAGEPTEDPKFKRGHRIELLEKAIEPLRDELSAAHFSRLAKALSLTYGLEVLLVLKDIWGLGDDEMQDVACWAANALVRASIHESNQVNSAA